MSEEEVKENKETTEEQDYFDDVYNFDVSICEYLIPRIKSFKEHCDSVPPKRENTMVVRDKDDQVVYLTTTEWETILQEMIDGFSEYIKDDTHIHSDYNKVDKALDHFRNYFYDLWI